jgi:hypothetical protein
MPAPLARLLKLRRLLEESSRMELERRAALAARIDRAQEHERQTVCESREQALAKICEDGAATEQAQRRTAEWMNADSATRREQQLASLARITEGRVAEARAELFERRKDRRQVESVLDTEQARVQREHERRTQRELDDWFGMKQIRQGRTFRKAGPDHENSLIPATANAPDSGNQSA